MRSFIKFVRSFILALWGKILSMFLPLHMKRIFFITTLYSYMRGNGDDEKELAELNEAMHLATTDVKALVIPSKFMSWVWSGNGTEAVHWSEETLRKRIVSRCPCWLNYGRDDDLLKDVSALQKFVSRNA